MGYINPLLKLPVAETLLALPEDERLALAAVLSDIRTQADAEAETAWRRRKWPMAAYWRAVATYARHCAHVLRHGRCDRIDARKREGNGEALCLHRRWL